MSDYEQDHNGEPDEDRLLEHRYNGGHPFDPVPGEGVCEACNGYGATFQRMRWGLEDVAVPCEACDASGVAHIHVWDWLHEGGQRQVCRCGATRTMED